MKIRSVDAFQIYDSRGNPTLEAEVVLENGVRGRGLVPSGASTGQFEALELRDGDPNSFRGRAVFRAIENVRKVLGPAVVGQEVGDQAGIDARMISLDGTPDKSRLGANAILGVSLAVAEAAAREQGVPLHAVLGPGTTLPFPEIQILGGGAHADGRIDVQDFMAMATGAKSYEEALTMTFQVYHAAGDILREKGLRRGLADEGGYWPEFRGNEEAFEIFLRAVERAGYTPGREVSLSLDVAASDLYDEKTGTYFFRSENRRFDADAWQELLAGWCRKYPVVSIEDPCADTDREGWKRFGETWGQKLQIVGDDLFTTNPTRIREGIRDQLANSVLIKLNQIGTVTETLEAIRLTQSAGWAPLVSARSGETEDAFIVHLAVATDAGQLKVGSFARGERMAKWNEGIRVGRQLGSAAKFSGSRALAPLGRRAAQA
jgi:enolase